MPADHLIIPAATVDPAAAGRESRYTTSMRHDTGEILFCEIWSDGRRRTSWLPFCRAILHAWTLKWNGYEVEYEDY
jgi:hypothetical protein